MTDTMTPPMQFGTKAPDEQVYDGSGNGGYMQYIGEDGEFRFRFLDNWNEWTSYWEHYSATKKASYPCTANTKEEKANCPGCTCGDEKEAKASKKYLANAVLVQAEGTKKKQTTQAVGKVHLWKIPGGLREKIVRAYEKSSTDKEKRTLLDRDFTIYRSTGARTDYDIERESAEAFDATDLPLQDHQEALRESWLDAWDTERLAARAQREAEKKNAAPAKAEEPAAEEPVPEGLQSASERRLKVVADEPAPEPEPEPEPQEEELQLTTSGIRKMTEGELLRVFKMAGIGVPEGMETKDLAEHLIGELSKQS